jgi:hypothetical protein
MVMFLNKCYALEKLPLSFVLKFSDLEPSFIFLLVFTEVLAFYLRALWSIKGTLGLKRMSFLRETAEVIYYYLCMDFFSGLTFGLLSSTISLFVFLIFIKDYKKYRSKSSG